MRVVFAGTPAFALPCIEALSAAEEVELAAVYTQPMRPAGRGNKLRPGAVQQFATARRLPLHQPESMTDPAVLTHLKQLRPDLVVVVAFGARLPPPVLAIAPLGCVNLHASLLPRWRGAAPIARAIEAGDTTTGVTLMQMAANIDTGPILATATLSVAADDTAGHLSNKLAELAAQVLMTNLPALVEGRLTATPQDPALACRAPKLNKAEAWLDWGRSAAQLARQVRAFNPWPGAVTEVAGMQLKVWRAKAEEVPAGGEAGGEVPGEVLQGDGDVLRVATADGTLVVLEAQLPGRARMPMAALLNGVVVRPGMRCAGGRVQ